MASTLPDKDVYNEQFKFCTENEKTIIRSVIHFSLCLEIDLPSSAFIEGLAFASSPPKLITHQILLGLCPNFLTFNPSTSCYQLSNSAFTIHLKSSPTFEHARNHAVVAESCLRYLCSNTAVNHKAPLNSSPFLGIWHEYAVLYWPLHLSLGYIHVHPELVNLFMPPGLASSPAFDSYSSVAERGIYGGPDLTLEGWQGKCGSKIWSVIGHPPDTVYVAAVWGLNELLLSRLEVDPKAIEKKSHEFNSPVLSLAAENGNLAGVRYLLDKGADVEARDGFGLTALWIAVMARQMEIVRTLLEKGAKPYIERIVDGSLEVESPLHEIANNSDPSALDMVKQLLDSGGDLQVQDDWGMTPLEVAMENGQLEMVELFLSRQRHGEESDKEPIIIATRLHHKVLSGDRGDPGDLHSELKKLRSSPFKSHHLDILLWQAANLGEEKQMKLLLNVGADPNTIHRGISAIYTTMFEDLENRNTLRTDFSPLKLLLEHGGDPNLASPSVAARTLLCVAAGLGNVGLIRLLGERGAQVTLAAENGPTPMFEAVHNSEKLAVETLLEAGADVDDIGHPIRWLQKHKSRPGTLLDVAEMEDEEEIAKLLLLHGAVRKRPVED